MKEEELIEKIKKNNFSIGVTLNINNNTIIQIKY